MDQEPRNSRGARHWTEADIQRAREDGQRYGEAIADRWAADHGIGAPERSGSGGGREVPTRRGETGRGPVYGLRPVGGREPASREGAPSRWWQARRRRIEADGYRAEDGGQWGTRIWVGPPDREGTPDRVGETGREGTSDEHGWVSGSGGQAEGHRAPGGNRQGPPGWDGETDGQGPAERVRSSGGRGTVVWIGPAGWEGPAGGGSTEGKLRAAGWTVNGTPVRFGAGGGSGEEGDRFRSPTGATEWFRWARDRLNRFTRCRASRVEAEPVQHEDGSWSFVDGAGNRFTRCRFVDAEIEPGYRIEPTHIEIWGPLDGSGEPYRRPEPVEPVRRAEGRHRTPDDGPTGWRSRFRDWFSRWYPWLPAGKQAHRADDAGNEPADGGRAGGRAASVVRRGGFVWAEIQAGDIAVAWLGDGTGPTRRDAGSAEPVKVEPVDRSAVGDSTGGGDTAATESDEPSGRGTADGWGPAFDAGPNGVASRADGRHQDADPSADPLAAVGDSPAGSAAAVHGHDVAALEREVRDTDAAEHESVIGDQAEPAAAAGPAEPDAETGDRDASAASGPVEHDHAASGDAGDVQPTDAPGGASGPAGSGR